MKGLFMKKKFVLLASLATALSYAKTELPTELRQCPTIIIDGTTTNPCRVLHEIEERLQYNPLSNRYKAFNGIMNLFQAMQAQEPQDEKKGVEETTTLSVKEIQKRKKEKEAQQHTNIEQQELLNTLQAILTTLHKGNRIEVVGALQMLQRILSNPLTQILSDDDITLINISELIEEADTLKKCNSIVDNTLLYKNDMNPAIDHINALITAVSDGANKHWTPAQIRTKTAETVHHYVQIAQERLQKEAKEKK